ncbi:hypothetical protein FOA52_004193 [Chlamydomonas sp. UWO 241]|nr:hypothetical protein FOA52_004193 [Chlamydomonas sp. UWO 241]
MRSVAVPVRMPPVSRSLTIVHGDKGGTMKPKGDAKAKAGAKAKPDAAKAAPVAPPAKAAPAPGKKK